MDKKLLRSTEFYKRRYQNFATLLIFPIACLFLFIVLFSTYATKEIVITTTGEITPTSKVAILQSLTNNTIETNNLKDNKAIKKGETLLTYKVNPGNEDNQTTPSRFTLDSTITTTPASLTSPADGILHLEKDFSQDKNIPEGTTIGEIYPDITKEKTIAITYYTTSNQIASIKKGQKVRLTVKDSKNKNVMIVGKVNSVDTVATHTKNGNLFKITAQSKLSHNQNYTFLKYGLQGQLTSIIAKQTYFDYYKDKLLTRNN